jgi:hypothetical protein
MLIVRLAFASSKVVASVALGERYTTRSSLVRVAIVVGSGVECMAVRG